MGINKMKSQTLFTILLLTVLLAFASALKMNTQTFALTETETTTITEFNLSEIESSAKRTKGFVFQYENCKFGCGNKYDKNAKKRKSCKALCKKAKKTTSKLAACLVMKSDEGAKGKKFCRDL